MKKQLLGAALLLLSAAASAEDPPHCRVVKLAGLPIQFAGLKPTLQGKFNGVDLQLLMDSGASTTVIFSSGVKKAGLREVHTDMVTSGVGGLANTYVAVADEVSIGPSHGNITDFIEDATSTLPEDGLLGADYLFRSDLELNLRENKVVFLYADNCGDKPLAYWDRDANQADIRDNGGPDDRRQLVEVRINGRSFKALLDSGASQSVLALEAAAKIGLTPGSPGVEASGDGNGIGKHKLALWNARVQSFEIGTEAIQNTTLLIGDMWGAAREDSHGRRIEVEDGPDMLLGADWMRAHHILFSRSQHRLYFTYLGGPVFSLEASPQQTPPISAAPPQKP